MCTYYRVGKIVNTHGLHGEVKVITTSDFKEERYRPGNELYLFMPDAPEGGLRLTVASHRTHQQFDLLKFEGHASIADVEPYKGGILKISAKDRSPLGDHEYYYDQIIGCEVFTEDGERLGKIEYILAPGANDVWVVKPDKSSKYQQEILIPYIADVVQHVDVSKKEVIIHMLEGLIDE